MNTLKRITLFLVTAGMITACAENISPPAPYYGRYYVPDREPLGQTAFFTSSDIHENDSLLTALLRKAVENSEVKPTAVILDGDYVGVGRTPHPEFSVSMLYDAIEPVLNTSRCDVLLGYGAHDTNCTDGYSVFFSGPHRLEGYYAYGISYAQMHFATDSAATAAILLGREAAQNGDEGRLQPPEGEPGPPPDGGSRPPGGRSRGYTGLDTLDRRGLSAESATRRFTQWVSTLPGGYPIVVVSHMPLHAIRKDNLGAQVWLKALNWAGRKHDIFFLWAHNHTTEDSAGRYGGSLFDRDNYLLVPGDSILVQTPVDSVTKKEPLRFTYVNAGYVKKGYASVFTFTDSQNSGRYDRVRIERFTVNIDDDQNGTFGATLRQNPYEATLSDKHN